MKRKHRKKQLSAREIVQRDLQTAEAIKQVILLGPETIFGAYRLTDRQIPILDREIERCRKILGS